MSNISRGVLAASLTVVSLLAPAAALAAPTVSIRIEGASATLLEQTTVTLSGAPTPPPGNCPGNTVAAAIEQATGGNWDREQFTSTILGETHTFDKNDYWGEWLNEQYGGGNCSDVVKEGDRIVILTDISGSSFEPTVSPLTMTGAPATVSPGTPFTVQVDKYSAPTGSPGEGVKSPAAGATISGTSATVAADGKATIALTQRGETTLKAILAGTQTTGLQVDSRSAAVKVCVTDGADGFCGTTKPGGAPAPQPAAPVAPCVTTGDDGLCGTKDTRPPGGSIGSVKEQQRFAKGKGPRTLAGRATDAQGVKRVRLRLSRTNGKACARFDGARERFVATKKCGAANATYFQAGTTGEWSYLLPAALGKGRYVLDVETTDATGNVDRRLERGRNRVVFFVS
jgi:hypothetical protein